MTLILSRASTEFVLQVTDRLVTYRQTKKPFDRVANKNILCFASNAVVAIAYTGDAYLDGIPTDSWIAKNLTGIQIDPEDSPMVIGGQNDLRRDIGQAFCILRNELDRQAQRIKDLLISVQGWQWNPKGRLRPLVGDIGKTTMGNAFAIHYIPRNWYLGGAPMTFAAPSTNISQEEIIDLSNRLRHKPAPAAEALLVNKIREISQRNPLVGPHCISILLPPPSNPNILVRYFTADSCRISESQRLEDDQEVYAYTPWIISPKMCLPPAQIIGEGFIFRTEPFSVHFVSQTPKHPVLLLGHSGQKRPKMP